METTKIDVEIRTSQKKEIKAPMYRVDETHAYKIISTEKTISVAHSKFCEPAIKVVTITCAFQSPDTLDCDKEHFESIYQNVAMKLALLATS